MIDRKLLMLGALLISAPVFALEADLHQDMVIQSDRSAGTAESIKLIGNVEIDQGSLKIRADQGEVQQKNGETHRVLFIGQPATLQQEIENQGVLKAEAKSIEYLLTEEKVILVGDVRIERPRGLITGERVVYFLDTGLIEAGEPGHRIKMTIKPKTASN